MKRVASVAIGRRNVTSIKKSARAAHNVSMYPALRRCQSGSEAMNCERITETEPPPLELHCSRDPSDS